MRGELQSEEFYKSSTYQSYLLGLLIQGPSLEDISVSTNNWIPASPRRFPAAVAAQVVSPHFQLRLFKPIVV